MVLHEGLERGSRPMIGLIKTAHSLFSGVEVNGPVKGAKTCEGTPVIGDAGIGRIIIRLLGLENFPARAPRLQCQHRPGSDGNVRGEGTEEACKRGLKAISTRWGIR